MYLFIDGINETDNQAALKEAFGQLLPRINSVIKLVISCRTDSFEALFQAPFWKEVVFKQEFDQSLQTRLLQEQEEDRLYLKLIKSFHQRNSSQSRQEVVAAKIRKQQRAALKKQWQLKQERMLPYSVVVEQFNEKELNEAIQKYKIKAIPVDMAKVDCLDPLKFKLFAALFGDQEMEVSNIFSLELCEQYLNTIISEVIDAFPSYTVPETHEIIYDLATKIRDNRARVIEKKKIAAFPIPEKQKPIIEKLVDAGLLVYRNIDSINASINIDFNSDRILSFVLAQKVALKHSNEDIQDRYLKIIKRRKIYELDRHTAHYLLLFLDRLLSQQNASNSILQALIQKGVKHPEFNYLALNYLADFKTLNVEWIRKIIFDQLREIANRTAKNGSEDVIDNIRFITNRNISTRFFKSANKDLFLIRSCINGLLPILQSENPDFLFDPIKELVQSVPFAKRSSHFYYLIKLLTPIYSFAPQQVMGIIEELCFLEEELRNSSGKSIRILRNRKSNSTTL